MNIGYSLEKSGARFRINKVLHPRYIECRPWPSLPSDIGPAIIASLTTHEGSTSLVDYVYNQRSTHVSGLNSMGYKVISREQSIHVEGIKPTVFDVTVVAKDIRAGSALVIGALARPGRTVIEGYRQIFRGYSQFMEDLISLDATVTVE